MVYPVQSVWVLAARCISNFGADNSLQYTITWYQLQRTCDCRHEWIGLASQCSTVLVLLLPLRAGNGCQSESVTCFSPLARAASYPLKLRRKKNHGR